MKNILRCFFKKNPHCFSSCTIYYQILFLKMPLRHIYLSKKAKPTKTKQTTQACCSVQAGSPAWLVPLVPYSSVPSRHRFLIPRHVVLSVFLFGNRILSSSPKCIVNFWQNVPRSHCLSSLPNCAGPFSALVINQSLLILPHFFLMDTDSEIYGHGGSRVTLTQWLIIHWP